MEDETRPENEVSHRGRLLNELLENIDRQMEINKVCILLAL